jgi:transcriptional regulator with PAS, ATPase and Fis domain
LRDASRSFREKRINRQDAKDAKTRKRKGEKKNRRIQTYNPQSSFPPCLFSLSYLGVLGVLAVHSLIVGDLAIFAVCVRINRFAPQAESKIPLDGESGRGKNRLAAAISIETAVRKECGRR